MLLSNRSATMHRRFQARARWSGEAFSLPRGLQHFRFTQNKTNRNGLSQRFEGKPLLQDYLEWDLVPQAPKQDSKPRATLGLP